MAYELKRGHLIKRVVLKRYVSIRWKFNKVTRHCREFSSLQESIKSEIVLSYEINIPQGYIFGWHF